MLGFLGYDYLHGQLIMNIIVRTGFDSIKHEIEFHNETIKKEKALSIIHVIRVEEIRINGISERIQASVIRQTSVNSPRYLVKLEVYIVRN